MLNHIVVMGRLARDPELRYTQTGLPVARFTLAVDRDFKDKDTGERVTDWIDCVAWRSTGEFVSKYFTKGRMAVVEGRLQIQDWMGREGIKRRNAEIVVENAYFGDSKKQDDQGDSNRAMPRRDNGFQFPTIPQSGNAGFEDLDDDGGDLPF